MSYTEKEEYLFIDGNKRISGVCSDNNCPCPQVPIPRNTGYFFIEKTPMGFFANLTCEQGARLRNLDLESAHQDAKMWWSYGRVPARESIKNYDHNQNAPFQNIQTGDALKTMDRIRRDSLDSVVELERRLFSNPEERSESVEEKKTKFVRDRNGYFFNSTRYSRITYPEIYLPDGISAILNEKPSTKLISPTKPEFNPPINKGLYFFWVFILVITIGMVAEGENVSGNLLIIAIMFAIGSILFKLKFSGKKRTAEEDYQKELEFHEKKLVRFYENQKSEFSELQILEWRTKRIKEFFNDSITFYPLREKVLKGKAESYFHKHLIDFFGNDKIVTDIMVGDFDRPYVPDFVYYDISKDVKIDIEIDEPYSLRSKMPIHYMYRDDKRNQYFNSKHWCVIRFSEEQVINYPERCCKVIHKELKKLNLHDSLLNQTFKFTEDLPPYKKWQKEEAEELKDNNFREFILDDRFFKNFEKRSIATQNKV